MSLAFANTNEILIALLCLFYLVLPIPTNGIIGAKSFHVD